VSSEGGSHPSVAALAVALDGFSGDTEAVIMDSRTPHTHASRIGRADPAAQSSCK
jgi:hypothetical protein